MFDPQTLAAVRKARRDLFAGVHGQKDDPDPLCSSSVDPNAERALGGPAAQKRLSRHGNTWQLPELVTTINPQASRVDRNVWVLQLVRWMSAGEPARNAEGTSYAVLRLRHFLNLLDREPELRAQVSAVLRQLWFDGNSAALFADLGFSPSTGLCHALLSRLWRRCVPKSPDTDNLATLFEWMIEHAGHPQWLQEIDDDTLCRIGALFASTLPQTCSSDWRSPMVTALRWSARSAGAAVLTPALRDRLASIQGASSAFEQIEPTVNEVLNALDGSSAGDWTSSVNYLRAVLAAARASLDGVRAHLRDHGVSANLLLDVRQVQWRLDRMEALIGVLVSEQPARDMAMLLKELSQAHHQERSVRGLFAEHYGMLATKLAERHALTGEHYLARDRKEYTDMLCRASGGGAVVAGTTLAKFGIAALGLAPLWSGLALGSAYAASFLLIYLLHWTLATKQPAMTAAALAARLAEVQAEHGHRSRRALHAFVDEVAALVRSQFASVLGNLGTVVPVIVALQGLAWWLLGQPLIDTAKAQHVLESLTFLGPTALFAALTGVLLFLSSLVGGWVENGFVYHRLQGAIAHHPRIVAHLGTARAERCSRWWRLHIHGVSSNIFLGLMLAMLPPVAAFCGLPLDVRHVTLSSGQLAAAVATLGWSVMLESAFWWCIAGIFVIGILNLGVSFALSLHMAMRARRISVSDGRALRRSLWLRLRRAPSSFLWPTRNVLKPADQA